jgi:hypothetical protein
LGLWGLGRLNLGKSVVCSIYIDLPLNSSYGFGSRVMGKNGYSNCKTIQ